MTKPTQRPATDSDGMQVAPANTAQPRPELFAISPAIGGLPAIYVPQSPTRVSTGAGLWRSTIRAARRVGRQAARHLPHHDTTRAGRPD